MTKFLRDWRYPFVAAVLAVAFGGASFAADDPVPNAPAPACKPESFRVMLDVGHTVDQPGATSARGVAEHVFNLRLAKRIERALRDGGFVRTRLLVVRGSGRKQLLARAKAANAEKPDLLLSIHHDDVQSRYHAQWRFEGRERIYSDRFAGWSLFVSQQNRQFDASLAFAKTLGAALRAKNLPFTMHHAEAIPGEGREVLDRDAGVFRYDALIVLKDSDVPAVLLEAGVIVNRAEEILLATPARQDVVAAAVLSAVQGFCAERK
ncbi:MAG: N-acetylmuramoyl-L-alanine amidase [Rhodoplanes sp.]|uniref:N-acetylmuramoyl-L-alanine amidase family protein n=1 Tax=Rhodoplanes sp. TaxID=1968906 RepID=UPI0017C37E90|nr:N-acetylmuramoyl-L-alanine amidase [Rhodoplanes sp.]NVO15927.1 N-acetylmuramoyl-L-alanine amidase [Rhodoplanes sp.]